MAWAIEQDKKGRWRWWVVLTAYGAASGEADSKEEAGRQLLRAQAELLAPELEERWRDQREGKK